MERSGWELVQEWLAAAPNDHRLLEADDAAGEAALAALEGVTEWSVLGAIARRAAVVVVEEWLHVLGAGGHGHPGLAEFKDHDDAPPGSLPVGVDVLGGTFAVNGGGLPAGELGEVAYLAPDTAEWMPCGFGHSRFVHWALTGDLARFYADLRWAGWRDDVQLLTPGQGFSVHPPLFSAEGRGPNVDRRPVPLLELFGSLSSASRQLRDN